MSMDGSLLSALFSRQLSILDPSVPTASKLLLVGTSSIGVEIARSLLMAARFQKIFILDDADIKITHFDLVSPYLFEKDYEQPRLSTVVARLSELNPGTHLEMVNLQPDLFCSDEEAREERLQKISPQMVICSGISLMDCIGVNNSCRKLEIPFGAAECFGLLCRAFFDWGPNFEFSLPRNVAKREFLMDQIVSDELRVVRIQIPKLYDPKSTIRFYSRFQILTQGSVRMNGIIQGQSLCDIVIEQQEVFQKIKKAFETFSNVRCEILPTQCSVQHQSLESEIETCDTTPEESIPVETFDQSVLVHHALNTLREFRRQHKGRFPDPAKPAELDNVLGSVANTAREWFLKALLTTRGQLGCINSYIANWLCNEVIKFFAKKYEPNPEQSHAQGFVRVCDPMLNDLKYTSTSGGDRLDGPRMCLGTSTVDALGSLQLAVIGAGALGCEDAKNFVSIGVGRTACSGRITYFDNDFVSYSNPTRQFCFSEEDARLRSPKAATLINFMTHRRPDISMEAYETKIGPGGHVAFDALDAIIASPDSELARFHCLMQCMLRKISYLNAGTEGLSASVDSFIPDICFQALSDPSRVRVPCQFLQPPATVSSKEEIAEYAIALTRKILPLVDLEDGKTERIKELLVTWFPSRGGDNDRAFDIICNDATSVFQDHGGCSIRLADHRGFNKDCPKHMELANTVASHFGAVHFVTDEDYNYSERLYAKAGVQPAIITSTAIASSIRTLNLVAWIVGKQRKIPPVLMELRTIGSQHVLFNPKLDAKPPSCFAILENCTLAGETFEGIIKLSKGLTSETIEFFLEQGFAISNVYLPGDVEDREIDLSESIATCFDREMVFPPTFIKYELRREMESNFGPLYYYLGITSSVRIRTSD